MIAAGVPDKYHVIILSISAGVVQVSLHYSKQANCRRPGRTKQVFYEFEYQSLRLLLGLILESNRLRDQHSEDFYL